MKKSAILLILSVAALLAFAGCSSNNANELSANAAQPTLETLLAEAHLEKAEISIWYKSVVPDSLRSEMAEWITKTVGAASQHMTGGDYEDPEDLVEEVYERAEKLYAVEQRTIYLTVLREGSDYKDDIKIEDLTPSQRRVYDCLNR